MSSNGWPIVPLGELLSPVCRPVAVDPKEEYTLLGARWYARGLYPKERKPGSEIKAAKLYRVQQGDFVYNRLFAWKGSFAVATEYNDGCFVSNEFPCFTANNERLDPQFLWYYFSRESAWNDALGLSHGATPTSRNRLNEQHFLRLRIPLPPLEEQRRIVARIDHLAAKIEEAQEQRRKMNADIAAFAASLHASLSKDRRVRMDSLVELHEERVPVETSGQYPQVGIKGFGGGLFPKPALAGTDTTYRHFNRLDADMLVLSQVKGWEGAIAVCPDELAGHFASPEYRTFRCIEDACDARYLDTVVRSTWFRHLLQRATHGQGARRERTRPERFLTLELPMPELDDQRKAARILSRIAESEPLKSHAAAACDALLPSILDRAFRGAL
jgi:type I restriction enzyme S subunit